MLTGIKNLDDQFLKLFKNTYTRFLVCKDWNEHMLHRKATIKPHLEKGIEMYLENFNKQFMINYKKKHKLLTLI